MNKKEELIKMWNARREEVEEKGNCRINPHYSEDFFYGKNQKYTKIEMLDYIDRMIKRVEEL